MAMFAVVLVVVVAASASALSPSLPGAWVERPDDRWHEGRGNRSRCHLVALAPALSRIREILCVYAARLGRTFNTHSYARYLTRLKKGGRK